MTRFHTRTGTRSTSPKAVYVFDPAVPDLQTLQAGVPNDADAAVLAGDGVRALAARLRGESGIEELHIVSHGRDGALVLGNAVLSDETMETYRAELLAISRALSPTADILLYGCEVAKTAKGEAFVTALAEATGASIAASRTLTGAANLGGDWDLDVHAGAVTAEVGFSRNILSQYSGVLTTFDFESNVTDNDTQDGGVSYTVKQTLDGITLTVSAPADINVTDAGGINGSDANVLLLQAGTTTGPFTFTFDTAVNLQSFYLARTATGATTGITFSVTDGSGNPNVTVSDSDYGSGSNVSLNWSGVTSFTVAPTDGSSGIAPLFDNISLAANTAPELGGTPADDTATEDLATAIDLSAYNVSDADGDTITLTLAVDRGTIASTDGNGTTAGVTVANSGKGSVTLQGTAGNLNTYLNDTSKITYTTASNDTTTAVLTVTPNDGTVNGTADTVNITISAVNDAPVLDAAQSPVLTAINEDAGDDDGSGADGDDDATNNANNPGTSVAALVVDGSITDADGGAVEAIAVTGVDNTNGVWQYSTDNGTSWTNFSGITGTSVDITSTARLLDGSLGGASAHLVRFVPDANYNGTAAITFRAWDKSSGSAGGTADASTTGNATPFSTASDTASVTVNAVNDAPVFTGLDGTPAFTEGGSAMVLDSNVTISDTELDALNSGNGDYSGASLTIARNGGANVSDVFAVPTGGNLTVAGGPNGGGTISAGGNVIATIANTGDGQIQLSFADNGTTPTIALVNEVLQAITYENTGNDLTGTPQLDWTFSDGAANGGGSVTVTLTDVNDAPTLTATGGNPTFTEGGGAQDIYNTVSADTIETGQTFAALTLTVTNVSDGASEILSLDGTDVALTNGNAVTTATNSLTVNVAVTGTTATVSFTGATLSNAQLQTLVDGLTYRNTSENPTTAGNRVVTITGITDSGGTAGGGVESSALNLSSTVTVAAVNDQPTLSDFGPDAGNVAYTAGATTFTAFDSGVAANLQDAELDALNGGNGTYNGATITLVRNGGADPTDRFGLAGETTALDNGSTVTVGGTNIGQVTAGSATSGTVTITFNSNATSALVDTFVQTIGYTNTNGVATGTVPIDFTFNDGNSGSQGSGGAQSVTEQVSVVIGNSPVLDLDGDDSSGTGSGGFATAFTESTPVAIADSDVSLTDSDGGATISAITITLSNDQNGADEGLTVSAAAQNALTGISGASTITRQDTITVTGANASLSEVQAFLQNVFYDNVSDAPDLTARTITVTVTDNDGLTSSSVTSTVSVANVNDTPVFAGVDNTAAFTEDGAAVVLDGNATVADAELDALNSGNGNYNGATLTLARNGGANAEDVFGNSGVLEALTEGGNLTYNGTTVGTVTTNSSGTLVLTFNTFATSALVDSVLQNITYSNTNDTPPANVQINYTFNDGNGGTQGSGGAGSDTDDSITVTITAANDAPVIANLDGDSPSGEPGAVITFDAGGNAAVTDADSTDFHGGTLTISRTGALEGNFALNDADATSGGDGTIAAGQTIAVGVDNIGTVDGTSDGQGANDLVIALNGSATPANVQALIRALTYQSSATGSHGFTVTLTDGDGGTSSDAVVTLTVARSSSGGGSTPPPADPITVATDVDTSGDTPTTTTTATTGSSGSGSVAIVESTNNNGNVVTVTLPANTTVTSTGPSSAQSRNDAVTMLVNAIDARDSTAENHLIGGARTFLNTLAEITKLDVRTIIPTTSQTSLSEPIVITGTSASDGATQSEAFVIDLRSLPTGSTLQLDNIEFASIIGQATLSGGAGENYVIGDDQSQFILLGEGNDTLYGGGGNDTVGSTAGSDFIDGGTGNDWLFGGAGADTLRGQDGDDSVYAGDGDDGADFIGLGAGNDIGYGAAGNDSLYGHTGNDELGGGAGDDELYGNDGSDTLFGNDGRDLMYGGSGTDLLIGGDGADTIRAGDGNDQVYAGSSDTGSDFLGLQAGNDTAYGGAGNDSLYGHTGNDELGGGAGADELYGNLGFDTLYGQDGNDLIYGGDNADVLYGGTGADTLVGGAGNDVLTGNSGADTFVFASAMGNDQVTDFSTVDDRLDLTAFGFTDSGQAMALASEENGSTVFTFDDSSTVTLSDIALTSVEDALLI